MKTLLQLLLALGMMGSTGCGGNKQAAANGAGNRVADEKTAVQSSSFARVPDCILKMIDSATAVKDGTGITEVRRYIYQGARVFLVGAPCCDQFNSLYDSACNMLFSPSGGFTGKGDRSHPGFFTEAREDSLIWKRDK